MITKNANIKISIIITFSTMIVSILSQFFFIPFLINKVSDAQYGLYGFANSCLTWLTVAVNAILAAYNKIASDEIAKDPKKGEEKTNSVYSIIVFCWSAIILLVSIAIIGLMLFGVINLDAYNDSDKKTIMVLFAIVSLQMVITVATKVFNLNIVFNDHHVWVKASTLVVTMLYPLISIPFLINGANIITIVIIQVSLNVTSHVLDFVFDHFVLKKKFTLKITEEIKGMFKPIFMFCTVIFINEIAYEFNNTIDSIVLGSKGYSELITLYNLALSVVTIAATCSQMIYSPFIPTIFKNEANNKREENLILYDRISYIQILLWLLITGGFISCGYFFVRIWVGDNRIIVYYISCTLFLVRSMSSCEGPARDMMRASNHHWQRTILALCVAIINGIITILLINFLGREKAIIGCLIGTAVSTIIGYWIIANVLSKKYLRLRTGSFLFNYLKIFVFMAISTAISLCSTMFLLNKITSSNILLFLYSGIVFVVAFSSLVLLIEKENIKKIITFIKQK